jgi:hypothetical protein
MSATLLTFDTLCEAIKHFLAEAVKNSDPEKAGNLTLWGNPDETMRTILEARGGKLVITVREMPVGLSESFPQEAVQANANASYWSPEM